jgi:methylthioribose-1-phosphate isomerase
VTENVPTIAWRDGALELIDQRLLPGELRVERCADLASVARAIKELRVRGAPAIGVAAAYGMVVAARESAAADRAGLVGDLERAADLLRATRPTAVNLAWAVARMQAAARPADSVQGVRAALAAEADRIAREDLEACHRMGAHGAELIPVGAGVLTHCNAGGLATSGYGTALGVIRAAWERGRLREVIADETRPVLQGARLTAWELQREGIPVTLIADGAAAHMMARGRVQAVIVGADRIAANGDVANKIGTYGVALAAAAHGIPFYVAAPISTIDLEVASGESIPIEERPADEVTTVQGQRIAPEGVAVANPAFDVTPAHLVTAIITERGVARAPYAAALAALVRGAEPATV